MSYLLNVILILVALNVPAHWLNVPSWFQQERFGAAFTDIIGLNSLSAFPTTYNANLDLSANLTEANSFTALNQFTNASTSKLSAYQAFFGATATSTFDGAGVLTLVSPLAVASGGTASTTISSNQVILGNGSSGFKTVVGWGTSGQFLTSGGDGAAPSWTTGSVDESLDYAWTGYHTFTDLFATEASSTNATTTNLTVTGNAIFSGSVSGVANVASTSVWSSSGTWTKPSGATKVFVQAWGGGGSGANGAEVGSGGGGGGEYFEAWFSASDLGSTVTVTIGAGGTAVSSNGTNGNNGTATTFGAHLTANAGAGGITGTPTNAGTGGDGGSHSGFVNGLWGGGGVEAVGQYGLYSGGGGGATQSANSRVGGASTYGGGGGGGSYNASGSNGGASTYGGGGGAGAYNNTATTGSVPGGGGGANSGTGNSGAGAAGRMIVTTFF